MGVAEFRLMEERLRKSGLRITPQRLELLRVLDKLGSTHPSFSQVYEAVRARLHSVSQSTVLKNMTLFEEIGIVQSFSFRGETHYELNHDPHVNLVDPKGKILDIEGKEIEKALTRLIRAIKREAGIDARTILVMVEQ
ncbi:MAG: Fur family transcriptional regulator [Candidatus Thorarchaeota archaeon]